MKTAAVVLIVLAVGAIGGFIGYALRGPQNITVHVELPAGTTITAPSQ
jgi:hypothetical protein